MSSFEGSTQAVILAAGEALINVGVVIDAGAHIGLGELVKGEVKNTK
jgi:hypothetical protein